MANDSVAKSTCMGRLLGSIIMTMLAGYLAAKGVEVSEADKAAGEQFIALALTALAGAVPGVVSKVRELKKGK